MILIDNNGNKLGLVSKEEALKKANELNLDLVKFLRMVPTCCSQVDGLWKICI